jgi:SAM-dependent MidA family methyltransferase
VSAPDPSGPDPALVDQLRSLADPDGFVPFDRFMEAALYSEEAGYYARPESPLGPAGDFYTAPSVTPLFAATFAHRVAAARATLPGRPFTLVDIGPGDGRLMAGILAALPPTVFAGDFRVALVERSASLRARAFRAVREVATAKGAGLRLAEGVGELGPFEGVVVSNELLDAQPVRRLRRTPSGWEELGVRVDGPALRDASAPLAGPVPGAGLPEAAAPGTVLEVSPIAEGIVREVADHLVAGVWLLDDYGMEERELVSAHPGGTLAAVRGHRSGADPLAEAGRSDLSAFVNWTRVRSVALAAGWRVLADRRQSEALAEWGLPGLLDQAVAAAGSAEAEVRLRLAVKSLLFGFERFRVLELAAGPPATSSSGEPVRS